LNTQRKHKARPRQFLLWLDKSALPSQAIGIFDE